MTRSIGRNPWDKFRKPLAHLRQPTLNFGNLWKSPGNLRQSLVSFRSLQVIFGNIRQPSKNFG